jgi:hypothetical protein
LHTFVAASLITVQIDLKAAGVRALPHWQYQLCHMSTEQINLTVKAVGALPGRQRMYQKRSIWQFQGETAGALL